MGTSPFGGGEDAALEGEDERFGQRWGWIGGIFRLLVDEGDRLAFPFPVCVPGLGGFVVPLLLEKGGAVGGEVDEENAVDVGGVASAAGVEALELVGGLSRSDKECGEEDESCNWGDAHGWMLQKGALHGN